MNAIGVFRAVSCQTRIRVGLSVAAVAYSTVGAVAQTIALDRRPADVSPWDSPMVWFSLVGLVLSIAGILIGVGALIQTVKGMREQLDAERIAREQALAAERVAREAFELDARESFARKDVLAATLAAMQSDLTALRQAQTGT